MANITETEYKQTLEALNDLKTSLSLLENSISNSKNFEILSEGIMDEIQKLEKTIITHLTNLQTKKEQHTPVISAFFRKLPWPSDPDEAFYEGFLNPEHK